MSPIRSKLWLIRLMSGRGSGMYFWIQRICSFSLTGYSVTQAIMSFFSMVLVSTPSGVSMVNL